MADDTNTQDQTDKTPVVLDPVAQVQKTIAENDAIARREKKDETTPGGRYKVNGTYVDADGKPHKNQKD